MSSQKAFVAVTVPCKCKMYAGGSRGGMQYTHCVTSAHNCDKNILG